MMLSRSKAALIAAFALSAGCSKAADAPPPPPKNTDQVPAPGAASQPAAAASQPAAAASQPAAEAFSGEVRLAEGVAADKITATDVLFLMARECAGDCTKPGRLVAVKRVADLKLPLAFTLGPENVMMAGTPFTGPFLVQGRVDRDGDAMTRGPDDLYAEVTSGVKPGQTGVVLTVAPLPPGATPPGGAAAPPGGAAPAANPHGAAPAANPH